MLLYSYSVRWRAALPTDLLQIDPHLNDEVPEHSMLPDGLSKPS